MVAFVVLKNGHSSANQGSPPYEGGVAERSEDGVVLSNELKQLVARDMGKPLAPSKIHFVSALPKTRNAKVMRRVLRSAYLGEDPGDLSSLENPQSIDKISQLRQKKS
jgi:acetyl-CoA synthetase